jgi:hypothetical protein
MSELIVVGMRKAPSADATHEHISDLCTQGAIHYTRQEVIESIEGGDRRKAFGEGTDAEIRVIRRCPHPGCTLAPISRVTHMALARTNLRTSPAASGLLMTTIPVERTDPVSVD